MGIEAWTSVYFEPRIVQGEVIERFVIVDGLLHEMMSTHDISEFADIFLFLGVEGLMIHWRGSRIYPGQA